MPVSGRFNLPIIVSVFLSLSLSGCVGLFAKDDTQAIAAPGEALLAETAKAEVLDASGTAVDRPVAANDQVDNPFEAPVTGQVGEQAMQPTTDIWQRIREGMQMNYFNNSRVQRELDWFQKNPEYMARVVERARPYLFYIVEEVERRGMPMELALLPIVESAFQPFAYSHGRASGIWQFIPATGRRYGLKQSWWYDGRRDIHAATNAALDYLQKLHKDFAGDWMLALAAYNAGEGSVGKAVRRNKRHQKPTGFFSLRLPKETRSYVPRLMAVSQIVKYPEKYNIALKPVDNVPYFDRVEIDGQIDLALVADLAGIDLEDLYTLNPGFNRWATDPKGPHYLLIPVEKTAQFRQKLAELPVKKRVRWVRHKIKNGETIGGIAQKYYTTTAVIREVNGFRGNRIRAGKSLTIPVATRRISRYSKSAPQRQRAIQHTPRRGKKIIYRVRRGDSFWEIARKYNVGVRSLARWNGMSPRDTLRPGKRLVIWTRSKYAISSIKGLNAAPPQNDIVRSIRYVVRRGDSLARIASRFKVTVAQLRRWNTLPTGKYLQPGQRLKLRVDVTNQL